MNAQKIPIKIPISRPLKKSFVIVALIFLLIGFGIEYGGPNIPAVMNILTRSQDLEEKQDKEKKDNDFDNKYWEGDKKGDKDKKVKGVKGAVKTAIDVTPHIAPAFDITVEDEYKDVYTLWIKYPATDAKMLEDGKRQIIKQKWDKDKEKASKNPPGFGLEADGLYIWTVFFSILISLIGMLVTKASVHRIGMIASLVSSIIVIFLSIFLIVKAIIKLIIMLALLFSGLLSFLYFIIYEIPFPTGVVLSLAGLGLFCKILSAIFMWTGGSNIIRIKSFTILILIGFVTSIIILVVYPIIKYMLVAAIADAIIGIIIAIIVIIWSLVILIGSLRGLVASTIK